ncbi:putative protein C16orf96 [Galemys pyrenaicus]|uniref:DUF4795 domain-containing protein n=1 Tax=Galemys pyrenaicus TaxID=202257 RepID=A0A8J6DG55_GALPY|nr:putative protein C16orf96 [Galemys pyrenaicus]
MSFSLTFAELVNIAIPQGGVLNFKALHLLLQGLLDRMHMAELTQVLSGDEDFLRAGLVPAPPEGDAPPAVSPAPRLGSVFEHVVGRVDRLESQLAALQDLPSTVQLLEGSQGTGRPAEGLWHLIKLRKMVEGNEEALAKSMKTLQDLLTSIQSLRVTAEALRSDVDMLKDIFAKVRPERVDVISKDLKSQHQKMSALQREMMSLQNKVVSIPKAEDTVLWSSLHDAMFSPRKSQHLQDAELWKVAEDIQRETPQQATEAVAVEPGAPARGQVQEAIQGSSLLHTVWHGPETSAELQDEDSAQAVPLPEAHAPGQPQEPQPGPPTPGLGPELGLGVVPGFAAAPWPAFRPGPAFGPGPVPGPGSALGPGQAFGPGPPFGPGPVPWPGPVPGLAAAPDAQPAALGFWPMPPGGWPPPRGVSADAPDAQPAAPGFWPMPLGGWPPPRGVSAASHWPSLGADHSPGLPGQPQSLQEPHGPPKLWPQFHQAEGLPTLSEDEPAVPLAGARVTQHRASREGAPRDRAPDVLPAGPPSALKQLKNSASIAAAAAAAYAAAAASAAETVRAAVRLVQDVPATKLATRATTEAASGPMGVFADELGAGSARGAVEDRNKAVQVEDTPDGEYEDVPLPHLPVPLPSDPALVQALLSARQAVTPEEKKDAVKQSMSHIAQMPIRHDSLKEEMAQLSTKLQQRLNYLYPQDGARTGLEQWTVTPPARRAQPGRVRLSVKCEAESPLPWAQGTFLQLLSLFLKPLWRRGPACSMHAGTPLLHQAAAGRGCRQGLPEARAGSQRPLYWWPSGRADIRASSKLGMTVDMLQDKVGSLMKSRMKEEELERVWGHQIEVMKDHYLVLNKSVERVQIRLDELKGIKAQLRRLDANKADKKQVEQELREKADRGVLAGKANRVDVETVAAELNELVQGLLLKVTGHEDGWKKALERLRRDLEAQLPRRHMDSLRVEMDEIWMAVRRLLVDGFRFDPDSAAGFRKKLFERVKCLSCDRQVALMNSPQLITVRRAQLLPRLRPASADSFEHLQRQQMREQQQLQQLQDLGRPGRLKIPGSPQDWGDGPANDSRLKTGLRDLTTLYPYGDPDVLDYDTAEVDLLGVDGVLYKGRMSDQDGVAGAERELTAVKVPHPPLRNLGERSRHASPVGASSASLHPHGVRSANSGLYQTALARPPSLPPHTLLPPLTPPLRGPLRAPGPARPARPLRPESGANSEEPARP